ncbi:Glutathione S-transferase omega-like 2 [Cladobotryum mycophilum]|uniref:Glutathione S-transferase omega-like 2 n=1 Tax=Cladobotryum mycophilum TaxID=491253 RepID=A0ABR0SMZ5_9HYPO
MAATDPGQNYHQNGRFTRPESTFRNSISRDPNSQFPAEKGRYALYLSPSCPWVFSPQSFLVGNDEANQYAQAHRTLIVRLLKGLEDFVDLYLLESYMGPEGWFFSGENGSLTEDPLYGFKKIKDLYLKADPNYVGRYTVPVLWDKKAGVPVNNESSEIIRMFYSEFDDLLPEHLREVNRPGGGFYPENLRAQIDEINSWVYDTVNNGVYKVGLSKTQEAYDENIGLLFNSLDRLEEILSHGKPYLLGDTITEADVRLYTSLIRFDSSYYTIFQCNLKMIRHDYPNLHLWLRKLYWDQDVEGPLRGAFYRSTNPFIANYGINYVASRRRVVYGDEGPLIVPAGPKVLVEPLP